MGRFAQGKYNLKNPAKYIGNRTPTYRSSWEFAFMKMCDEHAYIQAWASEAVKRYLQSSGRSSADIHIEIH